MSTDIFSDVLFHPLHGTLGFLTIYKSINVKFSSSQCFNFRIIFCFYAILHVFVLYPHYDDNISNKKLNGHQDFESVLFRESSTSLFDHELYFHLLKILKELPLVLPLS